VTVTRKFAVRPTMLALFALLLGGGQALAQISGTPPAPQTSAPTAPLALGTSHDMGTKTPMRFTLERLTYALGWTHHYRSSVTVADSSQKMLVIHFKLENTGNADLPFRDSTLKYQAIDEQGVVHERATHMHVRAAGLTTAAEGRGPAGRGHRVQAGPTRRALYRHRRAEAPTYHPARRSDTRARCARTSV
jgi:hypothetical protein